jgi:hypothetical protein
MVCLISSEGLLDPRLRRSCRGSSPLAHGQLRDVIRTSTNYQFP